jgi:hypothetical protein
VVVVVLHEWRSFHDQEAASRSSEKSVQSWPISGFVP